MIGNLTWVLAAVVLLSSVWVAVDAARKRVPTYGERYDLNTGALAWFLGCLLLWIVVFPAYWVRRAAVLRTRAAQPSVDDDIRARPESFPQIQETPPTADANWEQAAASWQPNPAPDFDLGERVTERPLTAPVAGPAGDGDAEVPDIRINRGTGSEFCVVLALLLPLITSCAAFVINVESVPVALAMSLGTVVATAVLLAIDAAVMGTVDLKGRDRVSYGPLFLGVVLLWIVFYPVAFFRRRHFGRPNLGVLAILVTAFFVGAPTVAERLNRPVELPLCTSPEITRMVETLVKGNANLAITRVDGFRETKFDRAAQIRHGECKVHQRERPPLVLLYRVQWIDKARGQYVVSTEEAPLPDPGAMHAPAPEMKIEDRKAPEFVPAAPPLCTSPEVIAVVEKLLREDGKLAFICAVGHKEMDYDPITRIRRGQCTVHQRGGPALVVVYRVRWLDQAMGRFSVVIDSWWIAAIDAGPADVPVAKGKAFDDSKAPTPKGKTDARVAPAPKDRQNAADGMRIVHPLAKAKMDAEDELMAAKKPAANVGEERRFKGHVGTVWALAWSRDARCAYSSGDDKVIRVWNTATGAEVGRFEGHEARVLSLALSPDGRVLLSGGSDATVRVWDTASGKELRRLVGVTGQCWSIAFAPDGKHVLAEGSEEGAGFFGLWELATGKRLRTYTGQANCLAFHPDGQHFLLGGSGGRVKLLEIDTGRQVRSFDGHTAWIRSVAISADGRRALSVSGGQWWGCRIRNRRRTIPPCAAGAWSRELNRACSAATRTRSSPALSSPARTAFSRAAATRRFASGIWQPSKNSCGGTSRRR